MKLRFLSLFCAFCGLALASGQAAKTAVFVNNLAGQSLAEKASGFRAMVADPLNNAGYSVLSQQEIAEMLEKLPPGEADTATLLSTETSALRLAQTLGVDYILVANLISLGAEQKRFTGSGIETDNRTYTLRVSYGLLEASCGGGLTGDAFAVSRTLRNDNNLQVADSDVVNQLLQEAASGITARLAEPALVASLPEKKMAVEPVEFTVNVVLQGIRLPNVLVGPRGEVQISEQRFPVEAIGVDVTLDGVTQGSAPAEFAAMPGLHRLQLSREGFTTWERNVNLYEGFALTASMNLTPQGQQQWQELTQFLQDLQNGAQLNEAQVQVLEGRAQQLRQSGFKVDTTQAPTVNMYNSLWGPGVLDPALYPDEQILMPFN